MAGISPPEAPIPLTVVSGYLGAGKTTLINRAIATYGHPGLCVIVNDFGELSIDAEVLRRSNGQTLALANGCVCCSAASGLYKAFETALTLSPRPTQILLEASGVADPARLIAIARAEPDMQPGKVITMVDAASFVADLGDSLKAPDIVRQLQTADIVLLSKTDLTDPAAEGLIADLLAGIAPDAPVEISGSDAVLQYLFSGDAGTISGRASGDSSAHEPHNRYSTQTMRCGTLVDCNGFLADLEKLGPALIRMKGLIAITAGSTVQLLNVAGGRAQLEVIELAIPPTQSLITTIVTRGSGIDLAVEAIVRDHFTALEAEH